MTNKYILKEPQNNQTRNVKGVGSPTLGYVKGHQITKDEFETGYIKRSNITDEQYHEKLITMKCNCGDRSCNGWAAVTNNEESIKRQKELYT